MEREPPDHGCRRGEAHREGDPGERWWAAGRPGERIRARRSRTRSGLHEHGGLSQDVARPSLRSDPLSRGERRRRDRGERDHRPGAARCPRQRSDPILQARSVPSRADSGDTPVGVKDRTLKEFLAAVAAPTPTPGGGSVSALAGALSVALSRMVAGLARGKQGYEGVESELAQLEARARNVQDRLEALIEEDARAYEAVMAARRLPKSTEAERASRVEAMQAAYRTATEVPIETMELCLEALELAETAAKKGNRGAVTDAAVAILLAEAATRGASLNARVNLESIRDESFRTDAEARLGGLLRRADAVGHAAMAYVEGRL
ncbi:MAG: cyclodeaminase/cyclohydrolase family protein [Methanobacteriota archaeon]|nr:MAG: cyclodeaminase/cyclohydrolase family protein [Euryarchaeota archaeon]